METTEHISIRQHITRTFQSMFQNVRRKRKSTENMNIKHHSVMEDSSSNVFLTGAILFANVDNSATLGEYALKVTIGASIWVIMKITGDVISHRLRKK